ncbi:MAG: hypothetical protein K2M88_08975 [Muribaculaceae bacterium]|nr:hypothetical protein [Muribaculaceae bacterium]
MNLKLLRSSLFVCGALTASGFAFADVVLNNGAGTVSWDDFAAVINGTKTVNGDVDSFKANNPNDASVTALDDATTAYAAAQEAANTAAATVTTAETALNDAKTALAPYTAKITEAEDALSKADAELAQWNTQLQGYNNDVTRYTGQVTNLTAQLDDAKDDLATAQKDLDAATSYKSVETMDPDFKKIYDAAYDYESAYSNYNFQTGENNADINIWYKKVAVSRAQGIELAFVDPNQEGWNQCKTISEFDEVLFPETNPEGVSFARLYVYLGPIYTANKENRVDCGKPDINTLINDAIDGLNTVKASFTTTKNEPVYNDEGGKLQQAVTDAQTKVETLTADRRTANANLATANQNVADTQAKIDGYTKTVGTDGKTQQQTLQDAVETAKNNAADAEAAVTSAQETYDNAVADSAAKAEAATAAEAAVKTAEAGVQTAANNAAKVNYNRVTLDGNVEANTAITAETFSGTILGNGFTITNKSGKTLFDTFSGRMSNVAINGTFAEFTNGASFNNVAYWPGNNSNGAYYDEAGTRTAYSDLGALGFETRDNGFGVNFSENALTSLAVNEGSKVYSFTVYNFTTNNSSADPIISQSAPNYAVISNGTINTAAGALSLPANTFAQSATDDVAGMGLTNVFYGAANNYVADDVVITDGQQFCSPVDLTAKALTYSRTFAASSNGEATMTTVCLPFEISKDLDPAITAVCTFDKAGVKDGKDIFWFTKKGDSETIGANTPAVLITNGNSFTLPEMENVAIAKTAKMIVSRESDNADDNSIAFGNFKRVGVGEFAGDYSAQMGQMYGLQGGVFKPAGEGSTFPAFRMVIKCEQLPTVAHAPRYIRILDEDGIDITDFTTGINNITSSDDMTEFEVIGGVGEIIFNTEEDFGNVPVYSMEGKMVKMAEVYAGSTSVNVAKGIYIVMGKKVLVK